MQPTLLAEERVGGQWLFFYSILDIAGVNAYILYGSYKINDIIPRLKFMKMLSFQLVEEHLKRRSANERLPRGIRMNISRILKKPLQPLILQNRETKRKRCGICPRRLEKKTNVQCKFCGVPICTSCQVKICESCSIDT